MGPHHGPSLLGDSVTRFQVDTPLALTGGELLLGQEPTALRQHTFDGGLPSSFSGLRQDDPDRPELDASTH